MSWLLERVGYGMAISLAIGLLIGLERERRKGTGPTRAEAGIRTFALVGLMGGICATFGSALVAVGFASVALLSAVAYYRGSREDPGITTEVALVVTFLLGALADREPARAAVFGVAVTVLLAVRTTLHRFVKIVLTEEEFYDGLVFVAAAFVALPLLPDHAVGPLGAINPRTLLRLAVIVMAVSAAGHVGARALGPKRGLAVTGFASGFVSATATVGAMGARARKDPAQADAATAAAVISTVSTFIQLGIVTAATSLPVARALVLPILLGGVASLVVALAMSRSVNSKPGEREGGHAFSLKSSFGFAVTVSLALLASAAARAWLGSAGIWLGTGLTGFADAHAAAISAASLVASGNATPDEVTGPIMVALTTNSVSKLVVARTAGGPRFLARVGAGLGVVLVFAWGGMLAARLWL